ncbi:LysR family transcriptional regulator [Pokkaliibacter sp. MBI-7]|nr:LysR family transcriptional regulator [Pokkaliibacter sp. MBI-7]MDH2432452.1 LysR family transcriptional regulator [Pokkaliibacter sp. MBI-7]
MPSSGASPANPMAELGQVGDYEIRLLKVFKTVVECGGFSAAEAVLNVSRSTISVHMSNLEQRLKLTLCSRGRSGFALTEDGIIIYDAVRRLFSQMEDFRSTVNALHVQVSGELNLVASDTISLDDRSHFPEVLGEFCQRAPDVYINFETAPMNEIERRILNEEADVGFIPYHRELDGLLYQPIYEETCYLYCSNTHPLFHEPDHNEVRVQLEQQKLVHAGIQTNPDVTVQLRGLTKAASAYYYETRTAMVLSGAYIGFLPEQYVGHWVKEGRLKPLLPDERMYKLGIAAITRQYGRLNKPRDVFMELLVRRGQR